MTCLQEVNIGNQDAFAFPWVGTGRRHPTRTVEQLGTGEQCYEGQLSYYVWYEMFPNGMVQEGTQACINNNVDCPRPGDQISASVTATPGPAGAFNNYTLALEGLLDVWQQLLSGRSLVPPTCASTRARNGSSSGRRSLLPFGFQILPLVDYDQNAFERAGL